MFFEAMLSLLIMAYIIILPIFPSKYKLMGIPANGDSLLAFIILFYIISVIFNKNIRKRFLNAIKNIFHDISFICAIALALVMFVSVDYSMDKSIAISESIRFCTYIALYFIIKLEIRKKTVKKTLILFLIVAVVISIIGILGIPFGFGLEDESSSTGQITRIQSTLENSNNLGAFLILAIFPSISLFLNEKNKRKKILLAVGSLIILAALILTQSRNAMLAFALGCVCYFVIYNWKLLPVFIAAFGGLLFVPEFRNRVFQVFDKSQNLSRIKLWEVAVEMIKDHPIIGVGNGNYVKYYNKYSIRFKNIEYYTRGQFHPHNILLKVQSELGVMGSIAFISLITSLLLKLRKVKKYAQNTFYRNYYNGFLISFIAFLAMNILDNFFSAPKVIAFFWINLAIAEGIINKKKCKAT